MIDIISSLILYQWYIVSFYFWNTIALKLQVKEGKWLTYFPLRCKCPRVEPILSVSSGGWQCQDGFWPCQDVESVPRSLLIKDASLWTNERPRHRILRISHASLYAFKIIQNILFFRKYSGLFPSVTAFLSICIISPCFFFKKIVNTLGESTLKKIIIPLFICVCILYH